MMDDKMRDAMRTVILGMVGAMAVVLKITQASAGNYRKMAEAAAVVLVLATLIRGIGQQRRENTPRGRR